MKCDACGAPVENGRCTYCGKEFPEVVSTDIETSSSGKSGKKKAKASEPQKIVIENNYYYSDAPAGKQGGGNQKVQNRPYVKPSTKKAVVLWIVAIYLLLATVGFAGLGRLLVALFSLLLAAMACPLVTKLTWNVPKLQFYYRHKKIIVIVVVILWVLSMGV